jgi:uncharacterized protein involved in exopolysaccharide biosynthesis
MEPAYRAQARCFMPAKTNTVSLTTEEGNVPDSPLLPTANADFQDSLLGILQGADTRSLVASRIEGRDSEWLKKNVEFGVDRFNLITISAFDPDSKMALEMASEYLRAFQEKLDSTTKDQARGRLTTFQNGIDQAEVELATQLDQRLAFMRENGAVDFDAELTEVGTRQTLLESRIVQLATNIATSTEKIAELEKQIAARPERIDSASTTVNNPAAEQLQRNLIEANRELATLRLSYTDDHPQVIAKLKDVAVLESEIAAEDARILGTTTSTPDAMTNNLDNQRHELEVSRVGFVKEKELTENELVTVKARRLELSLLKTELDAMDADIRTVRSNLGNYRERKAELEVYMSRNSTFLLVPEYPQEPTETYFPIMWVNLLVAAILGITVGVGLVIIIANIRRYREASLW